MSDVEADRTRAEVTRVIDLTGTDATCPGRPRPGELTTDLVVTVAELGAITDQFERLARRHAEAPHLAAQLTQLAGAVRQLVDDLVAAAGERSRAGLASRRSGHPAGAALRAKEAAFDAWLDAADHPEQVLHHGRPLAVREVLTAVLSSRRPLRARSARELGVPVGTTTGAAAAWLLVAVDDPGGPRCRSFRSALYYLRDADDPAALVR